MSRFGLFNRLPVDKVNCVFAKGDDITFLIIEMSVWTSRKEAVSLRMRGRTAVNEIRFPCGPQLIVQYFGFMGWEQPRGTFRLSHGLNLHF